MKKLLSAIITVLIVTLLITLTPSTTTYCKADIVREAISAASEDTIMDYTSIDKWNKQNDSIYISTPLFKEDLVNKIKKISVIPEAKRYIKNTDGSYAEVFGDYYKRLIDNIDYDSVKDIDTDNIRYGFVIKRSALKAFPTYDEVFSSPSSVHDRFRESTLYPFEPVAILHQSKDKQWLFIKMYNYEGWINKADVAVTSEYIVKLYEKNRNFIVITRPVAYLRYSHTKSDMGCVFPLVKEHDNYYTVLCPKQGADGTLYFSFDKVEKQSAHVGYLPYTQKNILIQAKKFLNEPYGWGGMNGYRDCSALVMDIFRSMGIKLKRNTDQQETMSPSKTNVKGMSKQEKEQLLKTQKAGSLIFMDGHVMLYLGIIQDKPYIIHDITGYYSEGSYINAYKVTVTDVYIKNSKQEEYINLFTTFLFISN